LDSLAVAFLQFAGPKLLDPFSEFVKHVYQHANTYNPPIHDAEQPFVLTHNIILGGTVSVKEVKPPRQTKMNFASGRVATGSESLDELQVVYDSTFKVLLLYIT
jgi:hypothetical protein